MIAYPSPNTWTIPTVTSSTNLGPMTTPFNLPPDCLQNLYNFQTPGLIPGYLYTYYTQGCAISSCCPYSSPYTDIYAWLTTYYSPAVCPSSYRTCIGPSNQNSQPSETVAYCCPSAYECPNGPNIILQAPWWACQSGLASTTTAYLMDNIESQNTLGTESVTVTGDWNVAYPLQIRWKAEDLSLFTTGIAAPTTSNPAKTTLGSAAKSSAVNTAGSAVTVTPAATASSGGSGGGLSVGDEIAISIPSALIGVAGAILVAWLTARWKKKEKDRTKGSLGIREP